ncbi:MAG: 3-dehydroquinate synthase, partial [Leptospiraceae bacterium]|nr:3-dehydroquinate synthase [Leptospiraceae bacterium]
MILSTEKVQTETNSYDINLAENYNELIESLSKLGSFSSCVIISEKKIADYYYKTISEELTKQNIKHNLVIFEGKEKNKHISKTGRIYNEIIRSGTDRKSLILALGGGVVGDFSGFIASTYLRGIRLIQLPTSLLACVDSSVGGKVAVNADLGKNMIGAFHQPSLVYAALNTLDTLPQKEWKCGLAEVLKHSLLSGGEFFEKMKKITKRNYKKINNVQFFIRESVKYKSKIVSEDPKENGVRAVLNLGHTFAHAIESYTNYKKVIHGEAVSIGLVTALILSEMKLGLDPIIREEVLWIMHNLSLPYK